jgi:predicted porin
MQKKLIAVAIAGALAAPVAIADVAVSGSIRGAVKYSGSEWSMGNAGSRLRFKASEDLGNGQSAYMNYEFGVDSGAGIIQGGHTSHGKTKRLAYVGIKGDWGSFSVGSQWSTLFNTVGTFIDKSNINGGLGYWGNGTGQYRMPYSVSVTTQAGPVWVQGDIQMPAEGDDIDRASIGGLMTLGGVSLGAAINLAGVALSGGFTDVAGVGSGFGVNAKMAGVIVAYEESDSYADPTIWGHYGIGLGGGAKFIIELANDGTNTKGAGILRMDF